MTENDRLKARLKALEKRIGNMEARYEILIAFMVADAIENLSGEINEFDPE